MESSFTRTLLLPVVLLLILGGISGTVVAATSEETPDGSVGAFESGVSPANGNFTRSLQQMATSARGSRLGNVLTGRRVTVRVTRRNGSTVTRGIVFDRTNNVTVQRGGFSDPDLTVHLSETTLESIVSSKNSGVALEKAIKYGLISISATGASSQVVSSIGVQGAKHAKRSRIVTAPIDLDSDSRTDAILEIEALNADDDPEFDQLVRTVLRDIDDDGDMEVVNSGIRSIEASVTGSTTLDLNGDSVRDTLLRVTGKDTDSDGQLDQRTKVTLVDTRGDKQFDSFSETVGPVSPSTAVTGEWDLNNDGTVSARITVKGEDTDGDGLFDRKIMTVALDLDDRPGFESVSKTTARINPTLSISARFDTDDDGTPDAKATLSASDSNDDGGLDTKEASVVNDSDGDGVYDRVVARDRFRRGFISNTGQPIKYLNNPRNLTVIGVLASILSMLLQLIQGG